MERLTLDRQGARRGDLLAASLQLGDDTIAIQRIATMSIQDLEFQPWLTPRNQRTQSIYSTALVAMLFVAMAALGWFMLDSSGGNQMVAIGVGAVSTACMALFGVQALRLALKIKKKQPFFQLLIGTSDGRTSKLVDNNRHVLEDIRDVVRTKMDTGERDITGTFDLELDRVDLNAGPAPAAPASIITELPVDADATAA